MKGHKNNFLSWINFRGEEKCFITYKISHFYIFLKSRGVFPNVYICFEKKTNKKQASNNVHVNSVQRCMFTIFAKLFFVSAIVRPKIIPSDVPSIRFGNTSFIVCFVSIDLKMKCRFEVSIRRCLIQISHTLTFKNKINSHHSKFFSFDLFRFPI